MVAQTSDLSGDNEVLALNANIKEGIEGKMLTIHKQSSYPAFTL